MIATILPKRKLLNPVELSVKPDKTPARPIPADMVIAIDISEYLGNFFLIKSIPKPATRVTMMAPTIGLAPIKRPAATPAKDVCDRASPIMDSLFNTMMVPIQGMIVARSRPTRKALLINSYSNIS